MKNKAVFLIFILILTCIFVMNAHAELTDLLGKKVVMIIPSKNFRDEELGVPRLMLLNSGAEIYIASTSLKPATGMLGSTVEPDLSIGDMKVEDYDAVIFVGGSGASAYWDDPRAHKIAKESVEQGKLLCAICIAPVILAKAGVLEGKNATVWKGSAQYLKEAGARYTANAIEVSGSIITADGPTSAALFGQAIIEALKEK